MKEFGVGIFVLVVAISGWSYVRYSPNPEPAPASRVTPTGTEYEIILTDEGYVPKEVTIKRGDTVIFSNTTGRPFWPASNLHPSHRDYPEFDPREPVLANETWTFTFGKIGTWKYHDHLAPYFTGVIVVEE